MIKMIHESDKWSAIVNGIGMIFFLIMIPIWLKNVFLQPTINIGVILLYIIAQILFWPIQIAYHVLITPENERDTLRRIDRSSMMVLIAGLFSPIITIFASERFTWAIIVLWTIAIIGTIMIMTIKNLSRKLAPILGFLMGIFGILIIGLSSGILSMDPSGRVNYFMGIICIILGGIVYAIKKPDFKPDLFGFHEIYHTLNLIGVIFLHLLIIRNGFF